MATLQHIETKTNCFHCGDEVKTRSFLLDEKQFCCQGCQTVYSILSDNKLGDYYRISPNAGTKQANFQEREGEEFYQYDKQRIFQIIHSL